MSRAQVGGTACDERGLFGAVADVARGIGPAGLPSRAQDSEGMLSCCLVAHGFDQREVLREAWAPFDVEPSAHCVCVCLAARMWIWAHASAIVHGARWRTSPRWVAIQRVSRLALSSFASCGPAGCRVAGRRLGMVEGFCRHDVRLSWRAASFAPCAMDGRPWVPSTTRRSRAFGGVGGHWRNEGASPIFASWPCDARLLAVRPPGVVITSLLSRSCGAFWLKPFCLKGRRACAFGQEGETS